MKKQINSVHNNIEKYNKDIRYNLLKKTLISELGKNFNENLFKMMDEAFEKNDKVTSHELSKIAIDFTYYKEMVENTSVYFNG